MKTTLIALSFVITLTTFAAPSPAPETMRSFKIGVGFTGNQNGSGIGVDLASPRLFSFEVADAKRRSDFHLFALGASLANNNLLQIGGNFTSVSNAVVSVGLLSQLVPMEASFFSPYSRIGLDILFPSSFLAAKSPNYGMRVAFGCDFFFVRKQESFLGTSDESFFIEGSLLLLHSGADRIAGTPALLDGFIPQVGLRTHF